MEASSVSHRDGSVPGQNPGDFPYSSTVEKEEEKKKHEKRQHFLL